MREKGYGDAEVELLGRWKGGQKAYLKKREVTFVRQLAQDFENSRKKKNPEPEVAKEENDAKMEDFWGDFLATPEKKPAIKKKPVKAGGKKVKKSLPQVFTEPRMSQQTESEIFMTELERMGFEVKDFDNAFIDLRHACKRARLKSVKKKVQKVLLNALREMTEEVHQEISEQNQRSQLSPGQRSVKNELKGLEQPELIRQKARSPEVTPVEDKKLMTFGKAKKKKLIFGAKKRTPVKLQLSPKKKVKLNASPDVLNLKGRLQLSPKTVQKEQADKEMFVQLSKTFMEDSDQEAEEKIPSQSDPPISQD